MSFRSYLKDKLIYIIMLIFGVTSSEILLIPSELNLIVRIYIGICPVVLFLICFFVEYYKKKSYYDTLQEKLNELDAKYLISEITQNPSFVEGKILKEMLQETGKSMLENVNKYKYLQEDYKEYIEQALFYARSQAPEKDYLIKKQYLKEIINQTILKNKRNLIQNKVKLNIYDVDKKVYTDSKWCVFIINQIIQNAVKYRKHENSEIEIYAKEKKDSIVLYIKDNGIGIRRGEITRVFEKGFTGENGRKASQKATGIGLYLCKKLCNKLGLGVELNSEENVGTEVRVIFPKSSFISDTIS